MDVQYPALLASHSDFPPTLQPQPSSLPSPSSGPFLHATALSCGEGSIECMVQASTQDEVLRMLLGLAGFMSYKVCGGVRVNKCGVKDGMLLGLTGFMSYNQGGGGHTHTHTPRSCRWPLCGYRSHLTRPTTSPTACSSNYGVGREASSMRSTEVIGPRRASKCCVVLCTLSWQPLCSLLPNLLCPIVV